MNKEMTKWAEKKNAALRKALIETATAVTAMKKAEAATKKACKAVKEYDQYFNRIDLVSGALVGWRCDLEAISKEMNENADALWSYVLQERGGQTGG